MGRATRRWKELITEPVFEDRQETVITCDKCGRDLDEYDDLEHRPFANVLEVYLNQEHCVNDRIRMELCQACLLPIWQKICEGLGVDPDAGELRIGQD